MHINYQEYIIIRRHVFLTKIKQKIRSGYF